MIDLQKIYSDIIDEEDDGKETIPPFSEEDYTHSSSRSYETPPSQDKKLSSRANASFFVFMVSLSIYAVVSVLGALFTSSGWTGVVFYLWGLPFIYGIAFMLLLGVSVLGFIRHRLVYKQFKVPVITNFPKKLAVSMLVIQIYWFVFNVGDCGESQTIVRGLWVIMQDGLGKCQGIEHPYLVLITVTSICIYIGLFVITILKIVKSLRFRTLSKT